MVVSKDENGDFNVSVNGGRDWRAGVGYTAHPVALLHWRAFYWH